METHVSVTIVIILADNSSHAASFWGLAIHIILLGGSTMEDR